MLLNVHHTANDFVRIYFIV